jgi:hypothetical protein
LIGSSKLTTQRPGASALRHHLGEIIFTRATMILHGSLISGECVLKMMCTNELPLQRFFLSLRSRFFRARPEQGRTMRQNKAPLAFFHTRAPAHIFTKRAYFLYLSAERYFACEMRRRPPIRTLQLNSYGVD